MKIISIYFQVSFLTLFCFFHTNVFSQVQIGNPINAFDDWDFVGGVMAFSGNGDRVAYGESTAEEVRIYDLIDGEWVYYGEPLSTPIFALSNFYGTSISLSDDGNILAVGSQTNFNQNPFVKTYKYTNGEWLPLADDIFILNPAPIGSIFASLSGDGQRIFIGNPSNNNPIAVGEVSAYEFDGSNWMPLGNIIVGDHINDQFGNSLSPSHDGSRIAIGAYRNLDLTEDAGHVAVFELDSDQQNWTQIGGDLFGQEENDFFGWSLSLSDDGNRLAVGAPTDYSLTDLELGYVKTYEFDGSNWMQLGETFIDEHLGGRTGSSVSLSADGSVLAIGASDDKGDVGFIRFGTTKIYQLNDQNQWDQSGPTIYGNNEDDWLGYNVALSSSGHRVAIGATGNDDLFFNGGQITVFESFPIETSAVSSEPNTRLELYPNPASNIVNISGLNLGERQIKITSAEGILMKSYTTNENHIDLQGFTPGVYFISVLTQEGWRTEMIFKD